MCHVRRTCLTAPLRQRASGERAHMASTDSLCLVRSLAIYAFRVLLAIFVFHDVRVQGQRKKGRLATHRDNRWVEKIGPSSAP